MLTRVTVSGPSLLAPGETRRYTATAHYSHGSSLDVTADSNWFASSFIRIISPGVALGVSVGGGPVTAALGEKAGSIEVSVLQAGTLKLGGSIFESGGGPLAGATVAIISGAGEGRLTKTDLRGAYAFHDVAGQLRLRASADGLSSQIHDVVVTGNTATESFALTPVEPPADVSGVWTMTVAPAPDCRAGLPTVAQQRIYQVLIQQGTGLQMKISASTLQVVNALHLTGSIFGARVRLILPGDTGYGEWSTSYLYDQLSATEKLGFSGIVEGSVSNGEIRASMYGDLVYWSGPTFEPTWYCRASDHAVTLRRGGSGGS